MPRGGARIGSGRKRKPPTMLLCAECGAEFPARHPGRKYCSLSCAATHGATVRRGHPRRNRVLAFDSAKPSAERSAYQRELYRKNYRAKKYGLSPEELAAMEQRQAGRCAICGAEPETLYVDHAHSTGRVRGLLCPVCNAGLGLFKDDPMLCEAAAEYLRRHGGEAVPEKSGVA